MATQHKVFLKSAEIVLGSGSTVARANASIRASYLFAMIMGLGMAVWGAFIGPSNFALYAGVLMFACGLAAILVFRKKSGGSEENS